jgi:hypothetical protein
MTLMGTARALSAECTAPVMTALNPIMPTN